ncbi:MAG TPA: PspC domain-containing protein, partial [Flavisolibacter sp.]
NVDPAVVRLLFAIITFGGFGFGVLIYILLWIILPVKKLGSFTGKRFYRNPDDRIIAGVAGGLAAYFNKPAWMIRLIFAAPLILNILFGMLNGLFFAFNREYFNFPNIFFGSFTGTFFVAYIILWIVMPLAGSTYEKMEMRGEKVDVNRIKQNVQEGMSDFKTRIQNWGEEVKTSAQQLGQRAGEFAGTKSQAVASDVGRSMRGERGIGYVIGVLFKAFFMFVAGVIAFGLFVSFIVLVFGGGAAFWPTKKYLLDFALNGFWQYTFFWGAVIFFFAIPLIAFITWLIRRIMNVRSQRHYLGYIFSGLWFIGVICMVGLITSLARDARRQDRVEETLAIVQPAGNKMIVQVPGEEVRYSGDIWFLEDETNFDINEDSLKITDIRIRVSKSDDSNYAVITHKYSRGDTRRTARLRAEKIGFTASYADSMLNLGSGISIDRNSKYRGQRVVVEIMVPVGKKIRFDESVNKLDETHVRIRERGRWDRRDRRNVDYEWNDDYFFEWKTNVDYIMSENGDLKEAGVISTYQSVSPAADSLQRIRDEQKRVRDSIENEIRRTEDQMRQRTGRVDRKEPEAAFLFMPFMNIAI